MYVNLTKEKIDRIIDEHLIGGKVVSEYLIDDSVWGEPIPPRHPLGRNRGIGELATINGFG